MRRYDFDWVDAFTDRPFAGNPCAVVHGAGDIAVEDRLALVRETRLSECAFLVPSDSAAFGVRYYLAAREILFAGHPTVATITALVSRGLIDLSAGPVETTLEVGAGVVPIRVEGDPSAPMVRMSRPAPVFGETCDPAALAGIFGLAAEEVVGVPQIVSAGAGHCITLLRSRAAVERAVLDQGRLAAWQAGLEARGIVPCDPFLVSLGGATAAGDTFARLLWAPPNPPEDPMTGSATTEMAAYLWHYGHLARPAFRAEQGHGMGRPSVAEVEVFGPREALEGVQIGGQGVVLMSGVLGLP